MRIGVCHDSTPGERRVALSPDEARRLVDRGIEVVVEAGAGTDARFEDDSYREAGCEVADRAGVDACDLLVAVQRPAADRAATVREGAALIALGGADAAADLAPWNERRITVLALERIPRITRAQSMDVLSSQATAAGYQAVLQGASSLPRFLPMLTTAAGSIPPARVLVLGAGVAGLQAIATARRLGAVVTGFDIRAAAAEQVESLGARFLAPEALAAESETAGGYARELAEEQQQRVLDAVAGAIVESDLVIATAAIPNRPAPTLITRQMVETMKPGSVIVDVSAETGGNCELTEPGQTVVHNRVTVLGPLNLPSRMPEHASRMFARNVRTLIDHLAPEGQLIIDLDDQITAAICLTHDGKPRGREGS